MINYLYYAGAFIAAIGILVTVHEFGHYWVAQRLGVKVLRFAIGFGKPLWKRRVGRDNLELVIGMFPLGGYVKMLDESEGEVLPQELGRAFNRQKIWKRMAIVSAGPIFNFLFAILAYWAVYMAGIDGIKPMVGKVAEGSLAQQAGFQVGDEIIRIDDKPVQSWDQRRLYLFQRALDHARVEFDVRDRQGESHKRILDLAALPIAQVNAGLLERGIGLTGFMPEPLPVIGAVVPGPAAQAGLREGDRILEIDSQPTPTWEELVASISKNAGRLMHVKADRDGTLVYFDLTPVAVEQDGQKIGRINIRPKFTEIPSAMRVKVRFGPVQALLESVENTWSMSALTLEMLYRMAKREVSARNISGPITIAEYAGHSAKIGLEPFVMFLAVISISLGVLNLLPIPVLDGGHLLYYIIEAIKGSPVSERVMMWGQQIGVTLLAGLMILAFYNDLTRIFR